MPTPDRSPPGLSEPTILVDSSRPRAAPVRFGVIADPHLATRASGTWKVFHRTETLLARAVDHLGDRDLDRVLVLGDLTKDGEPRNFDRFDRIVADLSVPVDAIPGNHDVPKSFDDHESLPWDAFERRYAPVGFPAITHAGEVTIVSLNSARLPDGSLADTWAGEVSGRQLDELRDVLAAATNPVVLCHHNLYALPDHEREPWDNFRLRNAADLHEILAEASVPLVLSGHHHVPATASEAGVREVILPALCSFPQAVGIVHVDRSGTTVELHPIATPAEAREAYRLARDDDPFGPEIARVAAHRLTRLPLSDD